MRREPRNIPLMRHRDAIVRDCPLAPPATASVQARTLHRACLILGGVDRLARHLGESEPALRRWMQGEEPPPERAFLACVEIILLHAEGGQNAN